MINKLPAILQPTKEDIALLLAAKCHLGSKNVNNHMKPYMFSRRPDGIFIIHIGKLWEKLILAARVLVSIDTPQDIFVTSSSLHSRRPANKTANYLGILCNLGRFPPGQFTKSSMEPRLLLCMDPYDDAQSIFESSKCNIPVIAFANSHSNLKYVDLAIPCNNMGAQSIGVMCWLLTRAVLRLRGAVNYDEPWPVIPDMFFYNDDYHVAAAAGDEGQQQGDFNKPFAQHVCSGHYRRDDNYYDGQQQRDDGFSMIAEDDSVNWQIDISKLNSTTARASGAWDDDDNGGGVGQQDLTFNTSSFTTSTNQALRRDARAFSYTGGSGSRLVQPPQQQEPLDWAEDVPENAAGGQQVNNPPPIKEGGWDDDNPSSNTGNHQWQGESNW